MDLIFPSSTSSDLLILIFCLLSYGKTHFCEMPFAYVMNTANGCVSVLLTRLNIDKLRPNKIVPL